MGKGIDLYLMRFWPSTQLNICMEENFHRKKDFFWQAVLWSLLEVLGSTVNNWMMDNNNKILHFNKMHSKSKLLEKHGRIQNVRLVSQENKMICRHLHSFHHLKQRSLGFFSVIKHTNYSEVYKNHQAVQSVPLSPFLT